MKSAKVFHFYLPLWSKTCDGGTSRRDCRSKCGPWQRSFSLQTQRTNVATGFPSNKIYLAIKDFALYFPSIQVPLKTVETERVPRREIRESKWLWSDIITLRVRIFDLRISILQFRIFIIRDWLFTWNFFFTFSCGDVKSFCDLYHELNANWYPMIFVIKIYQFFWSFWSARKRVSRFGYENAQSFICKVY